MPYIFRPPVVMEASEGTHRLFQAVRMPRGVSLLVSGGSVVESRWPTIEQQSAADVVYMGGHEYVLTDAAAQVLIDAGFGDGLERADIYVERTEERY